MVISKFNAGGSPAMDQHPIQGGVGIFLVAPCCRKRDKLQPDEPLGSYADFTLVTYPLYIEMEWLMHNIYWY